MSETEIPNKMGWLHCDISTALTHGYLNHCNHIKTLQIGLDDLKHQICKAAA
jgi:hypothetical protein